MSRGCASHEIEVDALVKVGRGGFGLVVCWHSDLILV